MNNISFRLYGVAIIFPVIYFSCGDTKQELKIQATKSSYTYKIKLVDTIKVNYVGKITKIIDYNRKNGNMLVCDITNIKEVVQIDSSGKLINTIALTGEGPNDPGSSIFNLGYYNDSSIVINSSRGFYIYNESGRLRKIIKEPTSLMGYGSGVIPRIRHVVTQSQDLLFMHLKSSVVGSLFTKKGYKDYNPLTIFNIANKNIKNTAGYNEKSIFMKDFVYFGDPINIFDVDSTYLYSINDPEPKIYIYDLKKNFSLYNTISLVPENFSLPIKYSFGEKIREDRAELMTNSQILDINVYNKNIIVSYRSGVPFEEFSKKSKNNTPYLFRKFMKYYMIYIRKGEEVSHDIELPLGCTGVAFYKSNNFIILNTNPAITETENESTFYVAKISSD